MLLLDRLKRKSNPCQAYRKPLISPHFFPFALVLLRVVLSRTGDSLTESSATSTPELSSPPATVCLFSEYMSPLCSFSLALRSSSHPCTSCSTATSSTFSFPFHAWQPPHRQRPTSSIEREPGGACPFTRRHSEQMSTRRFFGCVSSSPRSASRMRSYQWDWVKVAADAVYCLVSSGAEKALGAKSAPMSSGRGRAGGGDGPCGEATERGCCGVAGRRSDGRWIFAVGGGAMPVRGPGAGAGFCGPSFFWPVVALGFFG
jgi:hypothetical protein